jgi:hypothetical protein
MVVCADGLGRKEKKEEIKFDRLSKTESQVAAKRSATEPSPSP